MKTIKLKKLKSRNCTLEELQHCFIELAELHNKLVEEVNKKLCDVNMLAKEHRQYGL